MDEGNYFFYSLRKILWDCWSLSLDQLQTFTELNGLLFVVSHHRSLLINLKKFLTWEFRHLWGDKETLPLLLYWLNGTLKAQDNMNLSGIWVIFLFQAVGTGDFNKTGLTLGRREGIKLSLITADSPFIVFLQINTEL